MLDAVVFLSFFIGFLTLVWLLLAFVSESWPFNN